MAIPYIPPSKFDLLIRRARKSRRRIIKWRNRRDHTSKIINKRALGYHTIYSIRAEMLEE